MQSIWHILSLLGDSRALLPTASILIGAGLWQMHRWPARWALGLATLGGVVLSSKLAFLGWGVGIAWIDFTGFSGHAAVSAAIWPVVFYMATPGRVPAHWGALAGLLLAAGIAYSRLPLGAHSLSEVFSGWILGALTSTSTLAAAQAQGRIPARWLALALAIGTCVPIAFPQLHTHQLVVTLAKALSGSVKEFDRAALHQP
ncbi:phosphatase PAP2 family protein [Stenotrophomonas tumulicola]|uniref:Phosphatase PAP2 family protein n=1 Tax=Stenotrophomonas tumulicola TaxID=1685415 RepID=A0A7W3IKJ2_9GAMM|nr:phosphatase PAP2 family protein [Stenotrophomonas tumulicola]